MDILPRLTYSQLGLASFISILGVISIVYRRKRDLPPGPRGLPFVGNIFQLPKKGQYLQFTKWKEQYGPIFSLNLMGQLVVVLNTHKVTADLLDRRSLIYSDRPRFIMVFEYLSGGLLISAAPYGELWRRLRRAAHEGLNIRAAEKLQPLQEREAATLAAHILRYPAAWEEHVKRSAASSLLTAVYNLPSIPSNDDPLVTRINEHMHRTVDAGQPGNYLVEIFPVMKLFPSWMAKWKRDALHWHAEDTKMFEELLDFVRKALAEGDTPSCLAASLLENDNNLSGKEIAWLAGTMFGAGAETTAAALSVFVLAMTLYPHVLRRAQIEIDEVFGRHRVPTFADQENLPFIRALVKETLRWRAPGPLGVPRRANKDDYYEGYFIPKGTVVIDPEVFPDPDQFRPERFLDSTDTKDVIPDNTHGQGHVSFGWGRRICVGLNVANQSLFIDMAYLVWALNIRKTKDSEGKLITPSPTDEIDDGLVPARPFQNCDITARGDNAVTVALLEAAQSS
ncbi:cytochrome P450 [Mycena galericulata]|nr:cytochrome P450 [Mycena galericulata]